MRQTLKAFNSFLVFLLLLVVAKRTADLIRRQEPNGHVPWTHRFDAHLTHTQCTHTNIQLHTVVDPAIKTPQAEPASATDYT